MYPVSQSRAHSRRDKLLGRSGVSTFSFTDDKGDEKTTHDPPRVNRILSSLYKKRHTSAHSRTHTPYFSLQSTPRLHISFFFSLLFLEPLHYFFLLFSLLVSKQPHFDFLFIFIFWWLILHSNSSNTSLMPTLPPWTGTWCMAMSWIRRSRVVHPCITSSSSSTFNLHLATFNLSITSKHDACSCYSSNRPCINSSVCAYILGRRLYPDFGNWRFSLIPSDGISATAATVWTSTATAPTRLARQKVKEN